MNPSRLDSRWHGACGLALVLLAACGDVTVEEHSGLAPAPSGPAGAAGAPMPTPPDPFAGGGDPWVLPEAVAGAPPPSPGDAGSDASGAGSGIIPATPLTRCSGASLEACGVFVTASGTELPLGPHGSIADVNVGAGFENPIAVGDADGGLTCTLFTAGFAEDPDGTSALLDTDELRFDLYTVFRPVNVVPGEVYPILTWGNGTCAQPSGYAALLHYLASYGFFVVAPNGRWVSGGQPLRRGIDFLVAANADPGSPHFGLIDTAHVGAMGHSQGGSGARAASTDPRVQSAILFNGGTAADKPFFALSGDFDIGGGTDPRGFMSSVGRAPAAAGLWFRQVPQTGSSSGHLTLMVQPERVSEPARRWFEYTLQGDADARAWFVGEGCQLCDRKAEFEFAANGLR